MGGHGTEWDSCLEEYPTYSARVNSSFTVAYNDARRELVLTVVRDSARQAIEAGGYFYGGYMQRNHNRDYYNSFWSHTYFIPVNNPAAVRVSDTAAQEFWPAAFSEDGTMMVRRRTNGAIFFSYTALGMTSSSTVTCDAVYDRIYPDRLERVRTLPSWRRYTCYPDAGFAP